MRYVVTGGAGFIGSHVVEALCERGSEVVAIDSLDSLLYPSELKRYRLRDLAARHDFQFVEADIAENDLHQIFRDGDNVIHLAATPGQVLSWTAFDAYVKNNITATQRLVSLSDKVNFTSLVQVSTSSVYGPVAGGNQAPWLHDDFERTLPISPYGVTKLAAEGIVRSYSRKNNLPLKILRLFSVFGPGQRPDMAIQTFLQAIASGTPITLHGDGSQSRDFTYVGDVAKVLVAASDLPSGQGLVSNVSSGVTYSIREALDVCFRITGLEVPVSTGERNVGDQDFTFGGGMTHLAENFGTAAPVSFEDGVAMQWDALLQTRVSD